MNRPPFFVTRSFWGKALGAFFGFLMAGSVGAIFGMLIGNFFDRGLIMHLARRSALWRQGASLKTQRVFLKTLFVWLGVFSKIDSPLKEKDIEYIKHIIDEMRLTHLEKKEAELFFNEGLHHAVKLDALILECRTLCHHQPALLNLFLDIAFRYGNARGLSEKKLSALNELFQAFGFAPLREQFNYRHYFNDFNNEQSHYETKTASSLYEQQAYTLLGVNEDVDNATLKHAYRKLISKHHPDKLEAQGLPASEIKKANDKTQAIRKAYEYLAKKRGF